MADCFADRLIDAITVRKSPAVVGLDPVYDRLPRSLQGLASGQELSTNATAEAFLEFGRRVIRIVSPLVPAVKINIAYFECLGVPGLQAYFDLVKEASEQDLIVIGDVKRGDVGHTAEMYAQGHLAAGVRDPSDRAFPDAVTLNGYFGLDGVKPFIEAARIQGRGVFVLVRTSNDSAATIQDITTEDGRKMHEVVASLVARWATDSNTSGRHGYTSVGAVVATRDSEDAVRLRAAMPYSLFLVPGYGAQGGCAEDFRPYFKADGTGAIVAAGRSIIFAHEKPQYQAKFGEDWEKCVEQACRDFVADLAPLISA